MSDSEKFWFHCGRCGSLFQSEAAEPESRLCPECGFDPCPAFPEPAAAPESTEAKEPAETTKPRSQRNKRHAREGASRHLMLKLMAGWTLLLVLIVMGARHLWPSSQVERTHSTTTGVSSPEITEQDAQLLKSGVPECVAAFSAYLSAPTPEARNQFVLKPISTASRMARFYSLNPLTPIDPATLELADRSVLHLPQGPAIGTRWKSKDGKQFDAVFRKENDEWRLDWEQFARYGDYPWPLFLAGSGPDEAEFRLLARERLAEERKNESTISIVLYAPKFGHPEETGFQSPELLVPRDSRDGRLLANAFQLAREDKRVFDSSLPDPNPEGIIRLRLKILRVETDQGRKFQISSIIANHWLSIDTPGVETAAAPAGKDQPAPAEP